VLGCLGCDGFAANPPRFGEDFRVRKFDKKQVQQHPYTLDFACLKARLCIEVDGDAHNRGEIACRMFSHQIRPGTGRCPVRAEGSHFEVCSAAEMWDPSVASRHLPVSGRN